MATGAPETPPRGAVLLLTSDIAVGAFARGAAEQLGTAFVQVLDAPSVVRRLAELAPPAIVVVNLETHGLEIAALVSELSQQPNAPRAVIAFGPHVHEQRLQAARDAGCTEVLSRGKFYAHAMEIVGKYL